MSDLIDRQALNEYIKAQRGRTFVEMTLEDAILMMISEVPSVEPERKNGKWKRRLVDSGFNADWHCSECGWKTSLEEHGYNFCPNCGADMRGKQDGNK